MCSIENLSVRTVYVRTYVRTHIPYIVSRFNITLQTVCRNIVHVATVAAVQLHSLGMLSQSRLQWQRLQCCRIYPQVGDKSHWNSRERVLEPEELSFLGGATDK